MRQSENRKIEELKQREENLQKSIQERDRQILEEK
jgi:hypothetical protein